MHVVPALFLRRRFAFLWQTKLDALYLLKGKWDPPPTNKTYISKGSNTMMPAVNLFKLLDSKSILQKIPQKRAIQKQNHRTTNPTTQRPLHGQTFCYRPHIPIILSLVVAL
jgi:hypothetical protein